MPGSGRDPRQAILIPHGWIQHPAMKPGNILSTILWAASALCSAQSVTIRIYDYAGLPEAKWTKATGDAAVMLAKAGYQTTWLICRGEDARPESGEVCNTELGLSDYVVRLLPTERNPAPGIKRALAYSQLDRNGGRYATLFLDAIQAHSGQLAVAHTILFSHVVAHEMIHLLRGPAHFQSGLMKPYWTRRDPVAISQLSLPVR